MDPVQSLWRFQNLTFVWNGLIAVIHSSLAGKDKTASQLSQLASLSSSSGFGLSTSQSLGGSRQVSHLS